MSEQIHVDLSDLQEGAWAKLAPDIEHGFAKALRREARAMRAAGEGATDEMAEAWESVADRTVAHLVDEWHIVGRDGQPVARPGDDAGALDRLPAKIAVRLREAAQKIAFPPAPDPKPESPSSGSSAETLREG